MERCANLLCGGEFVSLARSLAHCLTPARGERVISACIQAAREGYSLGCEGELQALACRLRIHLENGPGDTEI